MSSTNNTNNDCINENEEIKNQADVKDDDHIINHPKRNHLDSFKKYQLLRGCRRNKKDDSAEQIIRDFEAGGGQLWVRFKNGEIGEDKKPKWFCRRATVADIRKKVGSKRSEKQKEDDDRRNEAPRNDDISDQDNSNTSNVGSNNTTMKP